MARKPMSPERREQIRQWATGRTMSPETKAKMSAAALGRTKSPETRAKMSAVVKKRWQDGVYANAGAKRVAAMKGRPLSAEHKQKLSIALRGRPGKRPSAETREKMRLAKIGKPGPWLGKKRGSLTAEWASKIAAGNTGRPCRRPCRQNYNGRSFRSSWEVRVAVALDTLGVPWVYEPKRFPIDETATFLPDFYLPDDGAYWEVKGWYDDFSRKRVEGFRRMHPDIPLVLITKQALEMLEASIQQGE